MADALSVQMRLVGERLGRPITRTLLWLRVTPNQLTVTGLVCGILSAVILWVGPWWAASIMLIVAGACDALDGQVARANGGGSALGSYIDSVIDRLTDAILCLALFGWYAWHERWFGTGFAGLATLASILVPYSRAKAEALQVKGDDGLLSRAPRTVLLIAGLVGGPVSTTPILALIGCLGLLTVVPRYQAVRKQLINQPIQ